MHFLSIKSDDITIKRIKGCYIGGWSKALLALFACHPKFLASAKLFAVPKVPKVPNF